MGIDRPKRPSAPVRRRFAERRADLCPRSVDLLAHPRPPVAQLGRLRLHPGQPVHPSRIFWRRRSLGLFELLSGQLVPADLVVLDDDSPMLAGHTTRSLIDALVFSGFTLPIDRVMVNGKWQVEDGRHHAAENSRAAYAQVANKLQASGGLS